MTGSYFEDVSVEAVEETPGLTITSAHVAIYLGLTRELAEDDTAVPDLLPLAFTIGLGWRVPKPPLVVRADRKSTRLNSSHLVISYAVFCLKKKKIRTSSIARARTHCKC